MKRAFKIIKRILFLILLFLVGAAIYSFGFQTYEYIKVNASIKHFIDRANFETQIVISDINDENIIRKYYSVSRETFENDGKNVFNDQDKQLLGQKGDIFTTRQSPFPKIPVVHQFITYYYGGHAAIADGNNAFYEAIGFTDDDESIIDIIKHDHNLPHDYSVSMKKTNENYWLTRNNAPYDGYMDGQYYRTEFFVLRVKEATNQVIDDVIAFLDDKVEKESLYNYLFFLDMTNKYYCTDLVSRAYTYAFENKKEPGYASRLNDDGFITSVNDLILSKDTYVAAYVKIEKKNHQIIENIYYLEDVSND